MYFEEKNIALKEQKNTKKKKNLMQMIKFVKKKSLINAN